MQSIDPDFTETKKSPDCGVVSVKVKRSQAEVISVLAGLLSRSMTRTEKIWVAARRDINHPEHQLRLVISLRRSASLQASLNRVMAKSISKP